MERVHSYTPVYFAIYLSVGVGSCRKLRQFGVQGSGWIFLILSSLKAVGSRSIMIFKILLYFFLPPRVRSSRLWCCWLCRSSAPVVFPLLNFVDIKTYVYLNLSFHLPIYSTAFARRLTLFILVKAGCPSGETKEKKKRKGIAFSRYRYSTSTTMRKERIETPINIYLPCYPASQKGMLHPPYPSTSPRPLHKKKTKKSTITTTSS